jgi:hypothetical protein
MLVGISQAGFLSLQRSTRATAQSSPGPGSDAGKRLQVQRNVELLCERKLLCDCCCCCCRCMVQQMQMCLLQTRGSLTSSYRSVLPAPETHTGTGSTAATGPRTTHSLAHMSTAGLLGNRCIT